MAPCGLMRKYLRVTHGMPETLRCTLKNPVSHTLHITCGLVPGAACQQLMHVAICCLLVPSHTQYWPVSAGELPADSSIHDGASQEAGGDDEGQAAGAAGAAGSQEGQVDWLMEGL
jgi:hypothetical protein